MSPRITLTTGLVAAAMLAPSAAEAAPARIAGGQPLVTQLAVDDERTLWVAKSRLYSRAHDGSTRAVAVVEADNPYGDDSFYAAGSRVVRLEASGSRAMVVEVFFDELAGKMGEGRSGVSASLIDLASGRQTFVQGCSTQMDAALAGTLLITSGCTAEPGQEAVPVQLRDLTQDQPPVRLADRATRVDAAGRKVAWLEDRVITVLDADSGIRRNVDTTPLGPGPIEGWELAPDGAVAIAIGDRVALAPLGSPPRVIGRPGSMEALAFASGQVVVSVQKSKRLGNESPYELVALRSDGAARVLARGGAFGALEAHGNRLAYSSLTCVEPDLSSLWVQPLTDQVASGLPGSKCRLQLSEEASIDKRRRIRWSAACPNPVPARRGERCSISVRARIGSHQLGRRQRSIRNNDDAMFRWSLPRRLARAKQMRVTVVATMRGRTVRGSEVVSLD